jgi:prefoldin subunit 5
MIDQPLHVEDVIEIYDEKIVLLKKEIDRLNEEVQVLNMELMKLRANVIS